MTSHAVYRCFTTAMASPWRAVAAPQWVQATPRISNLSLRGRSRAGSRRWSSTAAASRASEAALHGAVGPPDDQAGGHGQSARSRDRRRPANARRHPFTAGGLEQRHLGTGRDGHRSLAANPLRAATGDHERVHDGHAGRKLRVVHHVCRQKRSASARRSREPSTGRQRQSDVARLRSSPRAAGF